MIFNPITKLDQKAFSLIEVIIIIVVAAISFTMVANYFGTYLTESSVPVTRLNHAMAIKQTAERITEHYHQNPGADLNGLKNSLTNNPGQYGQNYAVIFNDFVKFVSQNDTAISVGDPENLLKVKIRHNTTNEAITLLFARQ